MKERLHAVRVLRLLLWLRLRKVSESRSWIKTGLPVCGAPPPALRAMKVFSVYIRSSTLGRLNSRICGRKSGHLFRSRVHSIAGAKSDFLSHRFWERASFLAFGGAE